MHAGEAGTGVGDAPLVPGDVERILARAAALEGLAPEVLRARRDELSGLLDALSVAAEILSADVAVLRHCLGASASGSGPGGPGELPGRLPGVLAARPWGRGWAAPPRAEGDDGPEVDAVLRAGALWAVHESLADLDLGSPGAVAEVLARIEAQLARLSAWRAEAETLLAAVRAAIVREWCTRVARSLDTPA